MEVEDKKPKPKKSRSCCIIPIIIVVLIATAFIVAVYVIEKNQTDIVTERGPAVSYSETFNDTILPDYTVSVKDEEIFNQKMIALLQEYDSGTSNFSEIGDTLLMPSLTPDESIATARSTMAFLKEYYPEGYYLVIQQVLKTTEEQPMFSNFFLRSMDENQRIDLLVHELSHIGMISHPGYSGYGYVIEDKFVSVSEIEVPTGDELLKYITQSSSLDERYLGDSKQKIYTTLDEINSYTKSVRTARAYIRYQIGAIDEGPAQALSRQLFFLSLQLKNIKENHPDTWQALMQEKGFAYVMSRMVSMAKVEIQAAEDEGVSGSTSTDYALSIDQNLALVEGNQALFDEFYAATGISAFDNLKNLTQQELTALGIEIEKF
ncbi:MAG: hypothetical protein Q8P20_01415 [bacterium]|nr:hypothetical protein [bacterium]